MPRSPGSAPTALLPRALVAGAASGTLLGLASLPGPTGPLAFVALVPLLRALDRGIPPGIAAAAGGVAGTLFFGIGLGFLPGVRLGGGPDLVALYVALVAVLALPVAGLAGALAGLRRVGRDAPLWAAPGGWLILEAARSRPEVGIPCLHLGTALAEHPALIQPASWVGLYGLSAWVVAVNALVVAALRGSPGLAAAAWLALALPAMAGAIVLLGPSARPGHALVRIAAVQPAFAEARRHAGERTFHDNLSELVGLSAGVVAARPDLVVWPESAFERIVGPRGDGFLLAVAGQLGAPLLTGVWSPATVTARRRNAAVLASPDGSQRRAAEKVHPVPVYERAPTSPIARALARRGLWPGVFEPGRRLGPLPLATAEAGPLPLGVLVCVDSSYPGIARALRKRGARLFVEVSNEAATGPWTAGLRARNARLRAAELRAPFVRVANTGPSLWIDSRGRVRAALAPGATAAASRELEPAGEPPPATRLGDAPVLAAAIAAGGLGLLPRARFPTRRRRHESHEAQPVDRRRRGPRRGGSPGGPRRGWSLGAARGRDLLRGGAGR
jgi:apolipoprotein N-acyltransferase